MATKQKQASESSQRQKFREAAREAECDERPEAFDKALRRIATAPPPKDQPKPKKPAK